MDMETVDIRVIKKYKSKYITICEGLNSELNFDKILRSFRTKFM